MNKAILYTGACLIGTTSYKGRNINIKDKCQLSKYVTAAFVSANKQLCKWHSENSRELLISEGIDSGSDYYYFTFLLGQPCAK